MRFCVSLMLAATCFGAPAPPIHLRIDYLERPLGIDGPAPRMEWRLDSSVRAERQTAYRVQAASDPDFARITWDTGRVESAQQAIRYAGPALRSRTRYWWRVQWWNARNEAIEFGPADWFEMALPPKQAWTAKWIGGENLLRTSFVLKGPVKQARVYGSALGYYELRLNGRRVGHHVLDPAFTSFDKRALYATYDVTALLRQGRNAIGVMLGNGWYGQAWKKPPAAIVQLEVESADGSRFTLASDGAWQMHAGPVTADGVYAGEDYDARLEQRHWDEPEFSAAGWTAAKLIAAAPELSAQTMPPIRVVETITPHAMSEPAPRVFVFDSGQNLTGWARIHVRGAAGARVRIRYGEVLEADGSLHTDNLRYARATDFYTLRGEVWEPRFTYHGFRYVEISGWPGVPSTNNVQVRVVHSDLARAGSFASSNATLNAIQRMTLWTLRSNLMSIPTDGAQRDERMGWMADAHLSAESAMLNFDSAAFYVNFLRTIADEQGAAGEIPDVAPWKTFGKQSGDPAWAAGYALLLWFAYEQYGDLDLLRQHAANLNRFADYLNSRAKNDLLDYSYYGDWVSLERTPGELVSSAYFFRVTQIAAQVAELLGENAKAEKYRKRASRIRDAFNAKWLQPDATYAGGSQTASVLPLYFGITPDAIRKQAMSELSKSVLYHHNTHAATGIHGTKYLLPLLTSNSQAELAYDVLTAQDYPSFGYMAAQGATTFWELWQHKTGPKMNSHNHPAFAAAGAWLYGSAAGIGTEDGYRHIRIEPQITRDLHWVSAALHTVQGEVRVEWKRDAAGADVEIWIPANSTVVIPKLLSESPSIRESQAVVWQTGKFVAGAEGIKAGRELGYPRFAIEFEVGSGRYHFRIDRQVE